MMTLLMAIQGPVNGWIEKYFVQQPWSTLTTQTIEDLKFVRPDLCSDVNAQPSTWNTADVIHEICLHLSKVQCSRFWSGQLQTEHYESIYLSNANETMVAGAANSHDHALVMGIICADELQNYLGELSALVQHAVANFAAQPWRLFMHGFLVFNDRMELWIFDASGIYSSHVINLKTQWELFVTIMLGYTMMDDSNHGLIHLVSHDSSRKYLRIAEEDQTCSEKLYLDNSTITGPENFLIPGPTCIKARNSPLEDWDHVVKFKWQRDTRQSEAEMLTKARDRNVSNIVQLVHQFTVVLTAELRQGLEYGANKRFLPEVLAGQRGRQPIPEDGIHTLIFAEAADSTSNPGSQQFDNRTFSCNVLHPLGRRLQDYRDIPELLEAVRDAIIGHRSLLHDGKILHRDVSSGNILISEHRHENLRAFLIDLDSALDLTEAQSKPNELIGTRPFLAIGLLRDKGRHNYRHDLESFFYVFLWIAICDRAEDPPSSSLLCKWSTGNWHQMGQQKIHDMAAQNFERVLAEFTPNFKSLEGLAQTLRMILFPTRNGRMSWHHECGQDEEQNLYNQFINAFDQALENWSSDVKYKVTPN